MSSPADGPDAVLLDLDGTLIDTVDVWRAAYLRLGGELGVALAEDFWPRIAGRSMTASLTVFGAAAAAHGPDRLVARLVQAAADRLALEPPRWHWLPGARALVTLLGGARFDAGGPMTALVTSAWRAFTVPLLDAALGGAGGRAAAGAFDAVVNGDDVVRGKPAPDAYLRAAALLGVAPARCLVIEDSPTGVAAAEAAGMVVLAVPHAGPITAAPGRAVRADLEGLTLLEIDALYTRLRSEVGG